MCNHKQDAEPNPPQSPQDASDAPVTLRSPSADDLFRLHALVVAAIGRSWAETDRLAAASVVDEKLVRFLGVLGCPTITHEGMRILASAVQCMRSAL